MMSKKGRYLKVNFEDNKERLHGIPNTTDNLWKATRGIVEKKHGQELEKIESIKILEVNEIHSYKFRHFWKNRADDEDVERCCNKCDYLSNGMCLNPDQPKHMSRVVLPSWICPDFEEVNEDE